MYQISNSTRAEVITLLAALTQIQGTDTKTANTRRRATLALRRLTNAKKTTDEKNISGRH